MIVVRACIVVKISAIDRSAVSMARPVATQPWTVVWEIVVRMAIVKVRAAFCANRSTIAVIKTWNVVATTFAKRRPRLVHHHHHRQPVSRAAVQCAIALPIRAATRPVLRVDQIPIVVDRITTAIHMASIAKFCIHKKEREIVCVCVSTMRGDTEESGVAARNNRQEKERRREKQPKN
jgi:hypothetical protein